MLLILDELGYLPINQKAAVLLFQIISRRYERGVIVLTTNKPLKQWARIFNKDTDIASAVLDQLRHPAGTGVLEGVSHRMNPRQFEQANRIQTLLSGNPLRRCKPPLFHHSHAAADPAESFVTLGC